jgi:DNA-binding beta-propeller fold protein YncE
LRAVLLAIVVAALVATGLSGCDPATRHYAYVVSQLTPITLRVYDVDDGHRLVRSVPLPELAGKVSGMAASAVTDVLYLTSAEHESEPGGTLLAYDLRTDEVRWTRAYTPGVDALCATPDGTKLYLSSGEHSPSDWFFVLDASDGDVLGRVHVAPQTHNAVCDLDGSRAYLSSIRSTYLTVADTTDDHVIRRVGPFADSIRPFTINGRGTLAIVNVNRLIGFEVGDITTGRKLWRVPVPGYPDDGSQLNPSHGVGFTPDEREIWVVDSQHKALHVFDATGLPERKPAKVATIALGKQPFWITFSLDGRYAYPSTGHVIDTATRKPVATIVDRASKQLQVDVRAGDPVRVASRHAIGYVTAPP